jgi:CRP-like cAMP-binding protein
MIEAHLKKLRIRDDISDAEEAAIRETLLEVREVPANATIVHRGQECSESLLLLEGWMARAKELPEGDRQISELQFAGDFVDLHAFTLKRLDHNLVTLTRCRIAAFPHERLKSLLERWPHLARVYWLMTNIDAAIHREWTVSLGQRSALGRMAHLFCEIRERLSVVGLVDGNSYEYPLTQQQLSECLGMTPVHINRTLQELRRRNLIKAHKRRVTIPDLRALQELGDFDADYLYLEKRPR